MYITNVEEILQYANIVDIIQSLGVTLKKEGKEHVACCPFHNEKSSSFKVNEAKGIYKCFGCGESGNAVKFVMKYKKLTFPDAVLHIANTCNIKAVTEDSKESKATTEIKNRQLDLVERAATFYHTELNAANKKAFDYIIQERGYTAETIQKWKLGYCDAKSLFLKSLKTEKEKETALNASILSKSPKNSGLYDTLYNRIVFPLFNQHSLPIGLSGRVLDDKKPKYINPSNNELYNKETYLYGLNYAAYNIREKGFSIAVEGYTDVISLHQYGIENAVGTCGTAFGDGHANILGKYSQNIVFMMDADAAGQKATIRSIGIALRNKLKPYVYDLPKGEDPDSFARRSDGAVEIKLNVCLDGIEHLLNDLQKECKKLSDYTNTVIVELADILSLLSVHEIDLYKKKIGEKDGISKDEKRHIQSLITEQINLNRERAAKKKYTPAQKRDLELYGFFEDNNQYFFGEGSSTAKSNFIITPKLLVKGKKRIFEITNIHNRKETIDISPQDMTSVQKICGIVEGVGNFLFEGNDIDLKRIKRKIFNDQLECVEPAHLGYDSASNCFIMSNGLFAPNGEFFPANEYGVIQYKNFNFFVPAYSRIVSNPSDYEAQRKFRHYEENKISFADWSKRFYSLFKTNGAIGMTFAIGTIFSDVVFAQNGFFPLLYNFGVPGTGKSTMTYSLMHLFGKKQNEINISGTSTIKGKMATFAQFENAIVHLEEFKNATGFKDVETYKGVYNRHARVTKTYSNDSRTNTIPILSTAVICSQEKPTCEEAFYTRCIILTYLESEKNFAELKELNNIEEKGITTVLQEIYSHRDTFQAAYPANLLDINKRLQEQYKGIITKERILLNTASILAIYKTMEDKLSFPFTYEQLEENMIAIANQQDKEFGKGLELQKFWELVEDCIDKTKTIETPNDFRLEDSNTMLYMRAGTFYNAYAKRYRDIYGQPGMDQKSLIHYLKNNKAFLEVKASFKFGNTTTSCLVFDYRELQAQGVNLVREQYDSKKEILASLSADKTINDIAIAMKANDTNALMMLMEKKIAELKKEKEAQQIDMPF